MNIYVGELGPITHGVLIDAVMHMMAAVADEEAADLRVTVKDADGAAKMLALVHGLKAGISALETLVAEQADTISRLKGQQAA